MNAATETLTTEQMQAATRRLPYYERMLGAGPYKLIGFEDADARFEKARNQVLFFDEESFNPSGGCCEYCNTEIFNVYIIKNGAGETFKVGSTCIKKILEAVKADNVMSRNETYRIEKRMRQVRKAQKAKIDAWKVSLGQDLMSKHPEILSDLPHPNKWRAEKGDSMLDYATWIMQRGGITSKLKLVRELHKACGVKMPRFSAKKAK